MTENPRHRFLAAALVGALSVTAAHAQQVPSPRTAAEVPGPASGPMTKEYVQMVGRMPAPAGEFSIWLRAYWPGQAILDGTWKPPIVSRLP